MQPILLLHGAIGAASQLEALKEALAPHYDVHTFSFAGHGGAPLPEEGLSIQLFASELLAYLDAYQLHDLPVFGYSMGGYVALYLMRHHPGRISKLVTLATKFQWDPDTAEKESRMLDLEKIAAKLPAFAQTLAERHAPADWKALLQATADMMRQMGADLPVRPEDFAAITQPVLLLLGDRDKMVTLAETQAVYQSLPKGFMGMLPGTPHPLEQVHVSLLSFLIRDFLAEQ